MASASAEASPGGTTSPLIPCSTSSGLPPQSVTTGGTAVGHGFDDGARQAFPLDGGQAENIASRSNLRRIAPVTCDMNSCPRRAGIDAL